MIDYRYTSRKLWKILLAGLLALSVAGCGKENDMDRTETGGDGATGKMGLSLQLRSPLSLDAGTDTRVAVQELTITDVWVVQFSMSGSQVSVKNYANAEGDTEDTKQIIWDSASGFYQVKTGSNDFWNEDSQFYIITNAGKDHTGLTDFRTLAESTPASATIATLQSLLKELSEDESVSTAESGLLTAGPVDFIKKESGGLNTVAALIAHMKRAYARITVRYSVGSAAFPDATFTPATLTVMNVPKVIAFYERAGATAGNYPSIAESVYATNFVESVQLYPVTDNSVDFSQDTPLTFYMAGNLRGIGVSGTAQGKNLAANGPLDNDVTGNTRSLKGCTCIRLAGRYKYNGNPATGDSGDVGVTYAFYLGGNLINDYNIERGKAYTLQITIGSVNSADVRVSVTDGNVSVFDQVTVVPEINVDI